VIMEILAAVFRHEPVQVDVDAEKAADVVPLEVRLAVVSVDQSAWKVRRPVEKPSCQHCYSPMMPRTTSSVWLPTYCAFG
ncbi:MAG: hypothetical protein KDJ47_04765, partial [Hyphomicrobiaceae bacterium]|nr:hypothetical protein [Hyphomicrobiaceae bacterium]